MTSKVTPCVTMMICVAGCSSTTTQDLPYSRTLPPPEFDWTEVTEERLKPNKLPERIERLRAARKARKEQRSAAAAKPITVEVPMAVLQDVPPPKPVLTTAFETVPDSYLEGIPEPIRVAEAKPFFTPLKPQRVAPPPAPAPIKTAEAILKPMVSPATPKAVVVAEPIAYAQYVSVGPEYFSADVAPYITSRSETPSAPHRTEVAAISAAIPDERIVAQATPRERRIAQPAAPRPRSRPVRQTPDGPLPPLPNTQIVAIIPPRPDPEPRRVPSEPVPRMPVRVAPDRFASPTLRDDPFEDTPNDWTTRVSKTPTQKSGWSTVVEKTLSAPEPVQDSAPDSPVFRVRVTPPEAPDTTIASLDPWPMAIDTEPLPDLEVLTAEDIDPRSVSAPLPRQKPLRQQPGVQVAGSAIGVSTQPLPHARKPAANDPSSKLNCLVNRGSNDRMILVCEGVDVSQSQVFRAVIEGESAFRGLRAFDETEAVIATHGFNTERFIAMSQGPRSARDLAFLRALRKSGKQIRVKGRDFDLYLMKGDNSLATVLIEQLAASETPKAIKLN